MRLRTSSNPHCGKLADTASRLSRGRIDLFVRDMQGGMTLFSLFILLAMLVAIGMAIDTARLEMVRTRLQTTTDNAILAAADLDQALDAKAVVKDYFARSGLSSYLEEPEVSSGVNHRTVSAKAQVTIPTFFMDLIGVDRLTAPSAGTATESMSDIEIALVLDNSGSMDDTNPTRISLLKPAAKDFVDTVTRGVDEPGTTSVAIVPFASQVSVGADLLSHFSVTGEQDYSNCVTFGADDYGTTDMTDFLPTVMSDTETGDAVVVPAAATLTRTGHFDGDYTVDYAAENYIVCSQSDSRAITLWSTDAEYLKGRIEALDVYGWTSIEIGAKWGAAMLDPSLQPVLSALADDELVESGLKGQPFDYDRQNTMKILVIMSDGENTYNYDLKDGYRAGESPLFAYTRTEDVWVSTGRHSGYWDTEEVTDYSYYDAERGGSKYYSIADRSWKSKPDGAEDAVQLDWPEVWNSMSVKYFADRIKVKALGGSWSTYYNQIVAKTGASSNATEKNTRTAQICSAARAAGVTIFTIGVDTYGQGDATLRDCASEETYFYDVASLDIASAFSSIARQINQLRLTQ